MLHFPNTVTKYISRQVNFQTIDTRENRLIVHSQVALKQHSRQQKALDI